MREKIKSKMISIHKNVGSAQNKSKTTTKKPLTDSLNEQYLYFSARHKF